MKTDQEVLREAATYINDHGLIKGRLFSEPSEDTKPACCGLGALRIAVGGLYEYPLGCWRVGIYSEDGVEGWDQVDRVARAVWKGLGVRGLASATVSFPEWNDAPERTAAEVVDHLNWCADHYDEIPADTTA